MVRDARVAPQRPAMLLFLHIFFALYKGTTDMPGSAHAPEQTGWGASIFLNDDFVRNRQGG
jgi:hypothetical protein